MGLKEKLTVARGEMPADLLFKNAQLVNVISGEIYPSEVLVFEGQIVALGSDYAAKETIDLAGRYLSPAFIDAHVHIESSLATPPEFARAVVPHGVTAAITDPHEIANVHGLQGIHYMLEQSESLPMHVYVQASSCVPATDMETSGATLLAKDLASLLTHPRVLGLAEVMNYPGVIYGDDLVLDKIKAFDGRPIDGHAPALRGAALNAYVLAGIQSEHECTTMEEALEKLRLGLHIFIREGTATRNLEALIGMVNLMNHSFISFCTDDRIPASLIDDGSIDMMVRRAIAAGVDPIVALRMGTINTANFFGLNKLGAISPGRWADMIVFEDLQDIHPQQVFHKGQLVAENGQMSIARSASKTEILLPPSISLKDDADSINLDIVAGGDYMQVIKVIPDQIVTDAEIVKVKKEAGLAVADPAGDIAKMMVIDRHQASGRIGKGFIKGFGLKRGAIGGTVAHDHHNLILIGVDDAAMRRVMQRIMELGGGIVIADQEHVLAELALPVAGLMSDLSIEKIREQYDACIRAAQSLGSSLHDPLMTMSFMALEVIPSLKLTDMGLVNVDQFKIIDLFTDGV